MSISRRQFLEVAAAGATAANALAAGGKMPMRVLGRTGVKVSILGFGGGSRFLMYKEEEKAGEALNRALDLGITYVDSAATYGNGRSEELIGKYLGKRREKIWLVTKVGERKADAAMRQIERSLRLLKTDYVNLLHVHSLTGEKDLEAIEAKDGVLNVLYKLRDQKVARNIGITCHASPSALKLALERHDFNCTQMALNAARQGRSAGGGALKPGEVETENFEDVALPVALRKKMGVTAMKVFAQDVLIGKAPIEKLIRYSLSLPVAAAVCGMPKLEFLEENVRVAKAFKPMKKEEMRFLADSLSGRYKWAVDRHFRDHIDA
jgi:aryl-alcohol dehydrogenase-like predicted oxidoreductase